MWWLLTRSTLGFEFRTVGANPNAARSAGMSVSRTWILVMLIAGGLAGLAATAVIQGTDFSLNFQSYGTYGIDAITVALLGRARPLGVVLAALLFGALHAGGTAMQAATDVPLDITQVIQSLIVLFVAAPPLVRAIFRLRAARAAGTGQVLPRDGTDDDPRRHRVALRSAWTAGMSPPATFVLFGLVDILVFGPYAHHGDATFAFSQPFAKVTVPNLDAARRGDRLRARRRISIALGALRVVDLGKVVQADQHRPGAGVLRDLAAVLGRRGLVDHAQHRQPVPGHADRLDPADPGRAGRLPVRAVRRDQHRDRGPVAARRVRAARRGQRRSACLWLGLIGGSLAGGLVGLLLGVFAIMFLVDQIILGVVLNVFASGLTGYLYDRSWCPTPTRSTRRRPTCRQDPRARRHPDHRPGLLRLDHLPVHHLRR